MRFVVLLMTASLASGCSLIKSRLPPPVEERGDRRFECSGPGPAIGDTLIGGGGALLGTVLVASAANPSPGTASNPKVGYALGAAAFAVAAFMWTSAGVGYWKAGQCHTAIAEWEHAHPGEYWDPSDAPKELASPRRAAFTGSALAIYDQIARSMVLLGFPVKNSERETGVLETDWKYERENKKGPRVRYTVVVGEGRVTITPHAQHCNHSEWGCDDLNELSAEQSRDLRTIFSRRDASPRPGAYPTTAPEAAPSPVPPPPPPSP